MYLYQDVLVSDSSVSQVAVPEQGKTSVWPSQVYSSFFFFLVPHSAKRRTEQLRYAGNRCRVLHYHDGFAIYFALYKESYE